MQRSKAQTQTLSDGKGVRALFRKGMPTQTLGDVPVEGDAVKGQAAPRQLHDVKARRRLPPIQHQLRVLLVKLLAVVRGGDELRTSGF